MSADIELPRRANACSHFRWMPGMRDTVGAVCVSVDNGKPDVWWSDHEGGEVLADDLPDEEPVLPDMRDPATQGCMLTLIAERTGSMSDTLADIAHRMRRGATLPQALVEALESCP